MKNRRKHIRLRGYDYSSEGAYFITICTNDRKHFFGEIKSSAGTCCGMSLPAEIFNEMHLSEIGKTAEQFWSDIPDHFPNIYLDAFVVMPNHMHGILVITVGACQGMPECVPAKRTNQFSKPVSGSISVIVNQYKAAVTKWCNQNDHKYFKWQGRFHDHIIRDEKSYDRIRNYILSNPENWKDDRFY